MFLNIFELAQLFGLESYLGKQTTVVCVISYFSAILARETSI